MDDKYFKYQTLFIYPYYWEPDKFDNATYAYSLDKSILKWTINVYITQLCSYF